MDPILFVVPVFFVIAFIFSMLGMGGSQLYIPILFWSGMDFKTEAVPLGMLLNVVNSATAALTYGRRGLIVWRAALPFAISMVVFAPLGAFLNIQLPAKPLLVFFALFTAAAAILMLSGWKPVQGELSRVGHLRLGLTSGSVLGLVAGLIGRGGGSFVVPILHIAGLEARAAVGTAAFTVTCSGLSSFVSHIATAAQPRWGIWTACAAAVYVGSRMGSHVMAHKMTPRGVKLVFGYVLLGIAGLILVKDVVLG